MKMRVYNADVVESIIAFLKEDLYRRMKIEDSQDKVNEMQAAIVALGILEDRLFDLPDKTVDVDI